MELHIERAPLLKALTRVQTVVERRNTMPILGNALIESQEAQIQMTATNQEVSIRTICPATVIIPGKMTVNAKTLFEVVRELPDETVILRMEKRDRLRLSCGKAKFELAGLPCDLFPEIPQAQGNYRFAIEHHVLAEMLNKTHFATSIDESRFTLNGLFMQVTPAIEGEGVIRIVTTDTHRLAMVERRLLNSPEEERDVIIPRKAIQEIRRFLEDGAESVEIILDDQHIQLVTPEVMLISILVDGRFPDYRQVVPQGNPMQLHVNREQLLGVVKRMSVLSHEKSRGLRLDIKDGYMQFNTNNPEQELAEEEMQVALEGGSTITVGFNSRYLREFLAVMEGESALFSLKDERAPVLLTDPNQPGTQFVLMPMRV